MLIHRHQGSEKTKIEPKMSRLQTSSRYLSNSLYFRWRFKRWISTRYGFLFIIALLVVFFNEVIVYQWSRFHWPDIESIAKK
jgi:hypothetical protein